MKPPCRSTPGLLHLLLATFGVCSDPQDCRPGIPSLVRLFVLHPQLFFSASSALQFRTSIPKCSTMTTLDGLRSQPCFSLLRCAPAPLRGGYMKSRSCSSHRRINHDPSNWMMIRLTGALLFWKTSSKDIDLLTGVVFRCPSCSVRSFCVKLPVSIRY